MAILGARIPDWPIVSGSSEERDMDLPKRSTNSKQSNLGLLPAGSSKAFIHRRMSQLELVRQAKV